MTKIIALTLYFLVSAFVFLSTDAYGGQQREVTFSVEKMICVACPITVRKAMQRVNGVQEVRVNFEARTATVVYDPDLTTADQIGKSSADVGFPAAVIEDRAL
ncbi:MAG: hypothetical protein GQ538_07205 [Xanthomonadales bacterium]|nr:hypothetical protein [Xanthomonadales bacterium]